MATIPDPKTICLDVAIDHRIRHWCRPIPSHPKVKDGTHQAILEEYGHTLQLGEDEIKVTRALAGPLHVGGVAVTLQQPRTKHPFDKGEAAVIKDCATLLALQDLFSVVSCNSLDGLLDISIIDLLPYTDEEKMKKMTTQELGTAFQTATQVIYGKHPSVILCMGKIRLSKQHEALKGDVRRFENVGLGRTFRISDIRSPKKMSRVNCFHPGYALNHYPSYSIFRQLLLLEVAHTCGTCRSDWAEADWMDRLRESCSSLFRELHGRQDKIPIRLPI